MLVLLAALTSSISLMETVVSVIQDKFKLNRKLTCLVVFVSCVVIGLPSAFGSSIWSNVSIFGMDILSAFDYLTNSLFMPIVAMMTAIFVGYILKPKAIIEEVELSGKFKLKHLFVGMIKYVAPIFLFVILLFEILGKLVGLEWFML